MRSAERTGAGGTGYLPGTTRANGDMLDRLELTEGYPRPMSSDDERRQMSGGR